MTEDSDSEGNSDNEGTIQESVLPEGSEVGVESDDANSAEEVADDLLVGEDSEDD